LKRLGATDGMVKFK